MAHTHLWQTCAQHPEGLLTHGPCSQNGHLLARPHLHMCCTWLRKLHSFSMMCMSTMNSEGLTKHAGNAEGI